MAALPRQCRSQYPKNLLRNASKFTPKGGGHAKSTDEPSVFHQTEAELVSYQALGVRAFINVPLLRDGEYSAGIGAHSTVPHPWAAEEINLIREIATRMWTSVERARAETARRVSEAQLALELADSRQLQLISSSLIG